MSQIVNSSTKQGSYNISMIGCIQINATFTHTWLTLVPSLLLKFC